MLVPQEHDSALVASVPPFTIDAPGGHAVHCALPTPDLYEEVPQGMQPTLGFVASPPCPA